MLRIWCKIIKGSHIEKQMVAESDDTDKTIPQRMHDCMDQMARAFDLPKPVWLENHAQDINHYGKTAFRQDSFIEPINFSYLEIEIIEYDG